MLLCLPDFFYLLVKLSTDPEVPKGSKAQIVAALAYFLSPVDVIPDIIPGLGLLDDLYLAMIVTDNLLQSVSPDVIARYWPGDADLVGLIKTTLDKLNDKLGTGAIRRILARDAVAAALTNQKVQRFLLDHAAVTSIVEKE